ncbi:MAG: universal stress protein [Flavobacteriaceae bacterium]|jgi:nucleotide-binding universal stress UspA family protein|nr:universal stress protein [Flavobacteriaceae bacterium]
MKKILIPTDFSAQAYNAIKAGATLAKRNNAEVILLHILDLPSQNSDGVNKGTPAPEVMFFKNAAEEKLINLAHDPVLEGLTVYTSLILDRTSLGVTKSAENNEVDLIVMGAHGVSGAKEFFVGSNTEKVVRTSSIPVFVIKGEVTDLKLDHLIFASDFSENMKSAFDKAVKFNNLIGAKLHLLMINTPNSFKPTHVAEEILQNFLGEHASENFELNIYNDLSIEKGILNFSKKIDADLIAIATHGRKGLSHFFNGSISEDLVNHSSRSILTFKLD